MAVRDFCSMYQTFSNTSSQPTSPHSKSVQQLRSQHTDRRFLSEENKGCKNFRTYTRCDQVIGVLPKKHVTLKEFSRYSRLPAIGHIPEDRPKLLRQLTYTVLQPVYVRGPSEPIKFSPSREAKKSNQKIWKKKKLLPNRIRTQEEVLKELADRKRKMQEKFSRSVHGHQIQVSEKLIDTSKKIQDLEKVKGAFWIDI